MGHCAKLWVRPRFARWLGAAFLAFAAAVALPLTASAQDTAVLSRGDAAVTAFSGAKLFGPVPPDLHPLDRTFIDPSGATLRVFDLTRLGGAPTGQIADAPVKFEATAGEIGQVFGVTLDGDTANATPNIYLTATSLFGLQIVSAEGDRLVKGEPGARWMPGQFGLDKGGTPGSVWKIDGVTGVISLFANIKHDGKDNAGPGLGDIAYDPVTHQFFVSDLETGLIHRLGLDGSDLGVFDHGLAGRPKAGLDAVAYDASRRMNIESPSFDVEKPVSWGFADKRRMVFAVAVQEGRLYYSVAEPLQIWSVGLNSDGSFSDDVRLEIDVNGTPKGNVVTDILFDGPGTLFLAQRGEVVGSYDYSVFAKPEESAVLRYIWDETANRWTEPAGEFAIGLKPPHRSTEGGIALNYGYDPDGDIDYSQCRATLWTTGEHLREGEESERVYQGGARIVHGLQGNYKDKVRPANVPPFETWFIDNDGLYLDAHVYGHVGDVAIFAPCDKRTVAEPEPLPYPLPVPYYPPLPEPVPPTAPGIYIDKVCYPGIFGEVIHCIITVTNIGTTLSGPVDIWDAATILTGPGAGGAVIVTGVTPDGPDWICAPTPTPDLWCSLPPGALLPGATRSIDVSIDTGPLFGAGNFGFRNCASLGWPWTDYACDDGGTDIVVEKTAPAACLPGGACTFTVTITNTGPQGFSGPVQFTDAMFLPSGAALLPPIAGIVPDLGCAPAPAGLAFSCTAPLTLGPGASISFDITVTMPVAPPAYWAQNCFAVSAPGAVPPALPLAPGATSPTVSCAWVPVGAPAPLSNIRVVKTALWGGSCYKGAVDIRCDYEIEIINDGPSPYAGPLTFDDWFPPAATLVAPFPAGWACVFGPPLTCTLAAAAIPAGGSITVPVSLSIPLLPLEIAGCTLPNTATLTVPAAGTDPNFFAPDDTSTVAADAWLEWVLPDGTLLVTCDPTNLKTTKVAKGDFVAAEGGFRGEYVVTVTNMGPDPYKGPIVVDDTFGFAPSSVVFSAPWGCTGGGASFTCTHPSLELKKGESVELTVTVTVPEGKQCKLKNSAVMTFPHANTRFNRDGGDDAASAFAKIPSKQCVEPERPQCEPKENEFRSESGACVCKSGYLRDAKGMCVSIGGPRLCPDGKPVPKSGRCPEAPQLCEPGPNEERNEQGQCVCKEGFVRDKSGRCVAPPTPPEACGPNEVRNAQGQCLCKEGFVRDKSGRCVKPTEPTPPEACGPNEVRNAQGQCVCKQGFVRDKNGRCINPAFECREKGWTWDGQRCLPPANPADECRKKGWIWTGERCVPPTNPADECKKKGWIWNDKRKSCTPPLTPAEECRKKGWVWDGKTCKPPVNPADECKKKGWIWDGKRCKAPVTPSLNPADMCRKRGGVWDGKKCLSQADICKKRGGTWTGNRCILSQQVPR
ncbi:MAG TPA: hypothetical protein VNJ31_03475 [Methyloceanibacter sp.]|nr:hypothetical protein [Methyloceanibacter sp.]